MPPTKANEVPAPAHTVQDILAELQALGSESTRRIFVNHGAEPPLFGVKVGDLKPLVKRVRGQHELLAALFESGNLDAQYLVGLAANGADLSQETLDRWARLQPFYFVSEFSVPWLAAEHPHGFALGLQWLADPADHVQAAGWQTLSMLAQWRPDAALDIEAYRGLLERVAKQIGTASNRARYTMNGFVIGVGSGVEALFDDAQRVAAQIGAVRVDLGRSACKVPLATEYLAKVKAAGRVGKKRLALKC